MNIKLLAAQISNEIIKKRLIQFSQREWEENTLHYKLHDKFEEIIAKKIIDHIRDNRIK